MTIRITSSYKDPHAVVFRYHEQVYRQLNTSYQTHYKHFLSSGLYEKLVAQHMLVPHEEVNQPVFDPSTHWLTIKPQQLSFIAHPAEWSFLQWKDAAILTLDTLTLALSHGMKLKDATPYNIQLVDGRMKWIDTASFVVSNNNEPWIAYKQFCESLLGPLLLMHYNYADAGKLLLIYPNGIPLKTLTKLLPLRARFNFGVLMHVYFQSSFKGSEKNTEQTPRLKQQNLLAIADNLKSLIKSLEPKYINFDWDLYYQSIWVEEEYLKQKESVFNQYLQQLNISTAVDIGCNTGMFAKILHEKGIDVLAVDASQSAIDQVYAYIKSKQLQGFNTCIQDITDPTPATGMLNAEHPAFLKRNTYDLVVAVALIHHICIAKNYPFAYFLNTLASLGKFVITEFVPITDANVKLMLKNREDIFDGYTIAQFEQALLTSFEVIQKNELSNGRTLYLLKRK